MNQNSFMLKRDIRAPYLVQRGTVRDTSIWINSGRPAKITDLIKFHYMGAAEYEFGASMESLAAMHELDKEEGRSLVLRTVEIISDKTGQHPITFSALDDVEHMEYILFMKKLWEGTGNRTKGWHGFDMADQDRYADKKDSFNYVDFWWDIRNNVMFSFDKQLMNGSIRGGALTSFNASMGQ